MRKISAVFIASILIIILLIGVNELPEFGKVDNPSNNDLSKSYLKRATHETGSLNIVTGIILDYRALDTLIEAMVLFTGAVVIMILFKI